MKNNRQTKICQICGKGPRAAYNRPHSLHKTKKVVLPNLQKIDNQWVCTKCSKSNFGQSYKSSFSALAHKNNLSKPKLQAAAA